MSLTNNWRENTGVFISSRDGDDATGDGSQATPYKSLISSGGVINVRAGYYTGQTQSGTLIADGFVVWDASGELRSINNTTSRGDFRGVQLQNHNDLNTRALTTISSEMNECVCFNVSCTDANYREINFTLWHTGVLNLDIATVGQGFFRDTWISVVFNLDRGGAWSYRNNFFKGTAINYTTVIDILFSNSAFESLSINTQAIRNIQLDGDANTIGNTYASNERFSGTVTIGTALITFTNCFYTDDPGFIDDTYYPTVSSPLVNGRNIIGKYNPAVSFDQSDSAFDPANTGVILTDIDTSNGEFELTNPNGGRIKSSTDPNNMLELPFETTFQEAIAIIANYEYAQGDWVDTENYNPGVNDEVRLTAKYSFYNENTATLGSEILIENGLPVEVDSNGLGNGNVNANLQNLGAVTGKKFVIDLVPRQNGI